MKERPPEAKDFEFQALDEAVNYRRALIAEFAPWLKGEVLEIGAGIGQMTQELTKIPGVTRTVSVEPDPRFCSEHRARLPGHEMIQGTSADLLAGREWDAILSVNVLEHIEDDREELRRYHQLLRSPTGALCLFVPARPEIYAPIDKVFGHYRRYTLRDLREKLEQAGFEILRLCYFNWVGYFAWWANFCLLKRGRFEPGKVRLFDRLIFPAVHWTERKVLRPPFGQSLLGVARSQTRN